MTGGDEECVVVDTNVWAVAEGLHPEASDECIASCLALLRQLDDGLVLAVDEAGEILSEYVSALRAAKTSGFAVKLAVRLSRTYRNPDVCRRVAITVRENPPPRYEEVPERLSDFDEDDQKFLAVAVAEGSGPLLYAGLDREWWVRRADLHREGLNVQFLCAADLFAGE